MKLLVTILIIAFSAIFLFVLSGCVTDADGTTRFDAGTFNDVTRTTIADYKAIREIRR